MIDYVSSLGYVCIGALLVVLGWALAGEQSRVEFKRREEAANYAEIRRTMK